MRSLICILSSGVTLRTSQDTLELDLDVDLIDQAARAIAVSGVLGVHLPM